MTDSRRGKSDAWFEEMGNALGDDAWEDALHQYVLDARTAIHVQIAKGFRPE